MSAGKETIASVDLEALIVKALAAVGTSVTNAQSVARALVLAEADGQGGHGLSRVVSYAAQVKAGKVVGSARARLRELRPAAIEVDAAHGFAYPAFDLAIADLPARAKTAGIAAASIVRSHHAGALGLVVERLAAAGLVALMFANTPSAMAAWGGRKGTLGTNPIAFAAPVAGRTPLVIDLALSEVARGKIMAAAQKGQAIPLGWAVDADGQPTTDAKAALAGTLLPAGGAKGAALALMVEVLAAAVTGQSFAFEATSFLDDKGGPPSVGQLIVAIDPTAFGDGDAFAGRMTTLAEAIVADNGARLPGARRHALRQDAMASGLAVDAQQLAVVRGLAGV